MKKEELINWLARELWESKARTSSILNTVFWFITEQLIRKEKVTINNFWSFQVTSVKARNGVNPRTKEPITIPAMNKNKFVPSKHLKNIIK